MTGPVFLAEVLRLLVGFVLVCAAAGKLRTFAAFRRNLSESLGWSVRGSSVLAPMVVSAELALAGLIVPGAPTSGAGMLGALGLFTVFTGYIAYKYATEDIVKCACFGEVERSVSAYDLVRNLLLLACIGYQLAYAGDASALRGPVLALACGLASILTVVVIAFHEIAMLLVHADHGSL